MPHGTICQYQSLITDNSFSKRFRVRPSDLEQFECDRRGRLAKHPIDVPQLDDLTVVEDGDSIGQLPSQWKVVRDQHVRHMAIFLPQSLE